jgi:DNA-binding transcriptional MerR regulator
VNTMQSAAMKVGELAQQTGVSVRTLHYYDEIGLLSPSSHTDAGHRLYADSGIICLQQIMFLRQVGFSLEEIRDCLEQRNMEKGTNPASEPVQLLTKRWMTLVQEFSSSNPEIEKAVHTMYQQEPTPRNQTGIEPKMFE